MSIPVVAIVGRPNVGKSSLFNMLIGRRVSIVDPTAGVTRDRVSAVCQLDELFVELVDTGGHGIVDRDDLGADVERQIGYALLQADLVLFVVDAREGVTPLDTATAEMLRPQADKTILIANKADEPHMPYEIGELTRLGFGPPLRISAHSHHGRADFIEAITDRLQDLAAEAPADPVMKLALVGRRNAGKSTFLNAVAGTDRVIVSEIPGTTRDSIDVRFEKDDRALMVIDTAGVRKKARIADDVEYYAFRRALKAIRRADVVLFLIDATEPVGQVDKKLAEAIQREFKPCILVVNKWDLAKDRASTPDFGDYLTRVLPHVSYAPISFTSAKTARNIDSTIDLASTLFKQAHMRVGTGELNQILDQAVKENLPKPRRGSRPFKVYYATQVDSAPPTIVIFVNSPRLVTPSYERFLVNRLREHLPFDEVPIRILFKARRREGEPRTPREFPDSRRGAAGHPDEVRVPRDSTSVRTE